MKKLIAGLLGALLVIGAGVGFWIFLDSASAAATVGKTKITVGQVDDSVKAIIAERKMVSTTGMQLAVGPSLDAEVLNYYVILTLLTHTAATNGLTVTPGQLTARLAAILKQEGGATKLKSREVSANIAAADFSGHVLLRLYLEALATLVEKNGTLVANSGAAVQALVGAEAAKEGVSVNKKYGTWDAKQVTVLAPNVFSK